MPPSPPHNRIAERQCLGYAIEHPEWSGILDGMVDAEDYFSERHGWYHGAIVELGQEFTIPRMMDYLREMGAPESVADINYINELTDWAISEPTAQRAAEDVRRYSRLRNFIHVARRVATEAGEKGWRPDEEWLSEAESELLGALRDTRQKQKTVKLSEQLQVTYGDIVAAHEEGGQQQGTLTGFADLDVITGGWQPGDLVVVAGRPSMGKTAFATACAWNRGQMDAPVHIFSCEMTIDQLTRRMISAKGRINSRDLRTGGLGDGQWDRLFATAGKLSQGSPIMLTDSANWRVGMVCSEARITAARHGLGMVVVDYVQLLRCDGKAHSREREVAEISASLKALAKELRVPVMALSQLNRSLESRQDKRPQMSDLRDSGSIEQDADMVLFLYRDEVYNADTADKGVCEVMVSKNRNGSTGCARLKWTPEWTRFDSYSPVDDYA
jgi:replicative DNA helicase